MASSKMTGSLKAMVTRMVFFRYTPLGPPRLWAGLCEAETLPSTVSTANISPFAGEVKDFGVGPNRNLALESIGLGVNDRLYKRARINQGAERVEVIEQGACVVNTKMDLDNRLLIWGKVVVTRHNKMGKEGGGVVALLSSDTGACRRRNATNQRDPSQVVQDTFDMMYWSGIECVSKKSLSWR